MKTPIVPIRIERCRNGFGRLDAQCRKRLLAVINRPSQRTWNNAYTLIIGADGWTTLWQAVIEVDPRFPTLPPPVEAVGEDPQPSRSLACPRVRDATAHPKGDPTVNDRCLSLAEAVDLAHKLNAKLAANCPIRASVEGARIVFTGGAHGPHSLDFRASTEARVLAHWKGYCGDCQCAVCFAERTGETPRLRR